MLLQMVQAIGEVAISGFCGSDTLDTFGKLKTDSTTEPSSPA